MPVSEALEIGIDNYANNNKSIRYSVLLLIIGMVLQINGFTGHALSVSSTSFHGVLSLCHQVDKFTCCDKFKTEWMTAVFVFQCLGLVFGLPTCVCAILFTSVTYSRRKKRMRNVWRLFSFLTAVFLGVSGAIYSSCYWKNHILADHHLSTSFTTVILACLAHFITSIIITLNTQSDDDYERDSLLQSTDEQSIDEPLLRSTRRPRVPDPLLRSIGGPAVICVVCMDRRSNVRFNCNHVVCCVQCAHELRTSDNYSCPLCRTPITYLSDV